MTEETLTHANALKHDIKEMNEILDILTAKDMVITIECIHERLHYQKEWQGDSAMGEAFKSVMIDVATEKLNEYTAEFEAL